MLPVIIIVLIIIVIYLVIYNISLSEKIKNCRSMNHRVTNLQVVQDFINTIGEDETVDSKIKKINKILIEQYDIKYSTIVIFNGTEYEVKTSNVDEKHWDTLKSLHDVDMFKDSINTAMPKYVTVNSDNEKLPYQKTELGRAKSAIFFPLYITNVYIGYWIIESGIMKDFENIDTSILEVIKDNIVSVLKSVEYQKIIEGIVREDRFTKLPSEVYLYGEGRKKIDAYPISTILMLKIINIELINEKARELGNEAIIRVVNIIKDNISKEYAFVRYMGPKFVIAFAGVDINSVSQFVKDIKNKIESEEIKLEYKGKEIKDKIKLNFVLSTYYKGTGLEEVLKKEEEYLETADIKESNITTI